MFNKLNSRMDQIEHRNKGLCYNCSKKFSLRYRCKKLFVIKACLDEDQRMKVKGKLRQAIITILVDSGSTHNFVSEKLVEKVGLKPIFGYDVVLGTQWLRTLGKYVALQSLSVPDNKVVSHSQMERLTRKKKEGVLLQLSPISSDLQQLLDKYNGVFTEPKSLPPPRIQAHKIPLLSGQGPGCVKPYRYPHHQKAEIEN
ncbi:hypothetical protein AMTRI_Chr04g190320 [Amborella trichopoda]